MGRIQSRGTLFDRENPPGTGPRPTATRHDSYEKRRDVGRGVGEVCGEVMVTDLATP